MNFERSPVNCSSGGIELCLTQALYLLLVTQLAVMFPAVFSTIAGTLILSWIIFRSSAALALTCVYFPIKVHMRLVDKA